MNRKQVLLAICIAMIIFISYTLVHVDTPYLYDLNIDVRCDIRD